MNILRIVAGRTLTSAKISSMELDMVDLSAHPAETLDEFFNKLKRLNVFKVGVACEIVAGMPWPPCSPITIPLKDW